MKTLKMVVLGGSILMCMIGKSWGDACYDIRIPLLEKAPVIDKEN